MVKVIVLFDEDKVQALIDKWENSEYKINYFVQIISITALSEYVFVIYYDTNTKLKEKSKLLIN